MTARRSNRMASLAYSARLVAEPFTSFFIHKSIEALARDVVAAHGQADCQAMLFPTPAAARRCLDFVGPRAPVDIVERLGTVDLVLDTSRTLSAFLKQLSPTLSAVLLPQQAFSIAKQYWQHTGDGVSSRKAEFCHGLFKDRVLVPVPNAQSAQDGQNRLLRGPKRYQRLASFDSSSSPAIAEPPRSHNAEDSRESSQFLEERFGRNLDLTLVERARSAIRRRIAGLLTHEIDLQGDLPPQPAVSSSRGVQSLDENDVYLFPSGMNAIFNAHRALLAARGQLKSVSFGFPYVDSLKILEKFGPGCVFYGNGSLEDLDDLERLLRSGQRYLALFCEFPGNPLLACPDLERIRKLADDYDFAVVVDETIGTFANINVLPLADMVVSSLTKIFSGDSNVMGGSAVLNPESKYYGALKKAMRDEIYEDTYWGEDVIVMERNSRDFLDRVDRINANAEAICDILRHHHLVKSLFYPKLNPSKNHYDARRLPKGGYGGLLSIVFKRREQARAFYDAMDIAKGPSLGTNFTLCSPYVLLAHYQELSWAARYGVDAGLVRVSVGLEEAETLQSTFREALRVAEAAVKCP